MENGLKSSLQLPSKRFTAVDLHCNRHLDGPQSALCYAERVLPIPKARETFRGVPPTLGQILLGRGGSLALGYWKKNKPHKFSNRDKASRGTGDVPSEHSSLHALPAPGGPRPAACSAGSNAFIWGMFPFFLDFSPLFLRIKKKIKQAGAAGPNKVQQI